MRAAFYEVIDGARAARDKAVWAANGAATAAANEAYRVAAKEWKAHYVVTTVRKTHPSKTGSG